MKVDENLGPSVARVFEQAGHDVSTVLRQALQGASDEAVEAVCRVEARVLVTADLDFADITRFPPGRGAGTIVLRPHRHDRPNLERLARDLVPMLESTELRGALWIVQPAGVRRFDADPDPT